MNMKKTIAAIAACAMAVSAMATTVAAEQTEMESHTYSLVLREKVYSADFTFTAKNVTAAVPGTNYVMRFFGYGVDFNKQPVTVTVTDKSTKTSATFTFQTNPEAAGYDGYAVATDCWLIDTEDGYAGSGSATADMLPYASWVDNDLTNAKGYYIPAEIGSDLQKLAEATSGASVLYKAADSWGANSRNTVTITIPSDSTIFNAFAGTAGADQGIDVTVKVKGILDESIWGGQGAVNADLKQGAKSRIRLLSLDEAQTAVHQTASVATAFASYPLATGTNTTSATSEIFARLNTPGVRVGGDPNDVSLYYNNAKAVINDMIANYDDVKFTFNTATDNVLTPAWCLANSTWVGNAAYYSGAYAKDIPGVETWMGIDTYKAFPQHLYNLYGDEGTKYTYSEADYTFNNLFNAALVANSTYTMNQSSVQPFVYDATSVSFSWNELTGGAAFINRAATVDKLQLVTSTLWYWDNMVVTGLAGSADDASTEAGADEEGKELDEEDGDEDAELGDDDDADAELGDDEDADADADADVDADDDADADADAETGDVADETAGNPATGNAPIALAVIPVALAAAAVVAKKRG